MITLEPILSPAEIKPFPRFEEIARQMAKMPIGSGTTEWTHTFTRGKDGKTNLYCRQITMRKGDVWLSKIHLAENPYVVLKGKLKVITQDMVGEVIEAPYFGITKPGTQRLIEILEESVWITFHVTDKTDLAEIEADLILKQEDPRLLTQ